MYNPQLVTFLKVCRTGSFSRAAQELFITPSAVVQQINLLEKDLNVTLFSRTKRGVTLTKAGEYLSVLAKDYVQQGDQIRSALSMFGMQEDIIFIGTSMMEKCRLLFDLWMLFYRKYQKYKVQLVNFEIDPNAPAQAELVECVKDNALWQKGWNFLEICRVPLGAAVGKNHPLAGKSLLTLEDLKGTEVVVVERGIGALLPLVCETLREEKIVFDHQPAFGSSLIWECSAGNKALLAPLCWDDVIPDMKMKPCKWDFALPYGVFYKSSLSEPSQRFLTFIRDLYSGTEETEIIPVL